MTRQEQLRLAKRAPRARQRQAKIVEVQVRLPQPIAAKLAAARRLIERLKTEYGNGGLNA